MSILGIRAELAKLGQLLGVEAQALGFLSVVPEAQLRRLRDAASEHLFDQHRPLFRRLAGIAAQLPTVAPLLAYLVGPMLTARIASELPARNAAAMATRMKPAFVAQIAAHLDPRRARDMIHLLPLPFLCEVAMEAFRRRDFPTIGRFVDFLGDEPIRAVLEGIEDERELLRAAFYIDSRNRLDHLVRMLPAERRKKAVLLALDEQADLLDEILVLVTSVNYSLKRELGDLAASQGDAVMERIMYRAQEKDLWGDLLPVIACLSPEGQRKVVALPFLKDHPDVLRSVLRAADEHGLWLSLLPLYELFDDAMRNVIAHAAASLSREAITNAAQATMISEMWEPMLDLVRRMPFAKQCEFVAVLKQFSGVDLALDERIIARARAHDLGAAVTASGFQ